MCIRDRSQTGHQAKRYALSTIKTYNEWHTQFMNYQSDRHIRLSYDDINYPFYEDYVSYFSEMDYSLNSIGKQVKQLKTIMNAAFKLKIHQNNSYQEFKVLKTDVTDIALSADELSRLTSTTYQDSEKQTVLDIFLIGCYTALRYSDFSRLKHDHFKKSESPQEQYHIDLILSLIHISEPTRPY